jgi:hypothetical protein
VEVSKLPERVVALAEDIARITSEKIREIQDVTDRTKLLAINAQIEAAHAGAQGKGFAVVAEEVGEVSEEVTLISKALNKELATRVHELESLGRDLVAQVRGARLADLALSMIDIIDRNLYERSCDVRWWATDSAVVDACTDPNEASVAHACHRLGVILDSYTVYLDLWIADANGRVIANGRPDRYRGVIGSDVSREPWFTQAMRTTSGGDFTVEDVKMQPSLGSPVATYATAIRAGAEERGRAIGALGIFFDWGPQAQAVVDGVRMPPEERMRTRCMLVDSRLRVLASSDGTGLLQERLTLNRDNGDMGFYIDQRNNVVGYALTPGYETYRGLGWYGVVVQRPPEERRPPERRTARTSSRSSAF